jgi:hypothetical protein
MVVTGDGNHYAIERALFLVKHQKVIHPFDNLPTAALESMSFSTRWRESTVKKCEM